MKQDMRDDTLLSVENFAELDQQYEMILERINRFVHNAAQTDVPTKTMKVFFQQLESYIDVVDEEIATTKKKIRQSEKLKDQTIHGILSLNLSKFVIIKKNFESILTRFANGKSFDDQKIYEHNFESLQEIHETEDLIAGFTRLISENTTRSQKNNLTITLDDVIEDEVEQHESDFLRLEHELLLSINNMHFKIHEARTYLDTLLTGRVKKLARHFDYQLPQDSYVLESVDIGQTQFKTDYDQWMRRYQKFVKQVTFLIDFDARVQQLSRYSYDFVGPIVLAASRSRKHKSMKSIISAAKDVEKEHQLDYLLDVAALLQISPFDVFNQQIIADPYDTAQIKRLHTAYEYYQQLGALAQLPTIDDQLGALSLLVAEDISTHQQQVYLIGQQLVQAVNTGENLPSLEKLKTSHHDAQQLIQLHQQLVDKYLSTVRELQDMLDDRLGYKKSLQRSLVHSLVAQHKQQLSHDANNFIGPDHFAHEGQTLVSLSAYREYLRKYSYTLRSIKTRHHKIKQGLHELYSSLNNIDSYVYRGRETLGSASRRIISFQPPTSQRQAVEHALATRLEKKYTDALLAFSSQAWNRRRNTGGRSSGGSWGGGSSSSSRGGGRSSGGGGSFGGSRSSSGGTSW